MYSSKRPAVTGEPFGLTVGGVVGDVQVLKCRDHKTGEVCALKVIRNQKRFHKQALIEIRILDHLRNQVPSIHQPPHAPSM